MTRKLMLYHTILTCNNSESEGFKKIVGEGESAGILHLLYFPECFYTVYQILIWIMSSQ